MNTNNWDILKNVFEKYTLEFDIRDTVYIKTDPEQLERIVTGIIIRENGIVYHVSYCTDETSHYGFELSEEKDVMKTTTN